MTHQEYTQHNTQQTTHYTQEATPNRDVVTLRRRQGRSRLENVVLSMREHIFLATLPRPQIQSAAFYFHTYVLHRQDWIEMHICSVHNDYSPLGSHIAKNGAHGNVICKQSYDAKILRRERINTLIRAIS